MYIPRDPPLVLHLPMFFVWRLIHGFQHVHLTVTINFYLETLFQYFRYHGQVTEVYNLKFDHYIIS